MCNCHKESLYLYTVPLYMGGISKKAGWLCTYTVDFFSYSKASHLSSVANEALCWNRDGCRVLRLAKWRLRPFQRYPILHFPPRVLMRNPAEFNKLSYTLELELPSSTTLFHVHKSPVPIVKLSLDCVTQPPLHFVWHYWQLLPTVAQEVDTCSTGLTVRYQKIFHLFPFLLECLYRVKLDFPLLLKYIAKKVMSAFSSGSLNLDSDILFMVNIPPMCWDLLEWNSASTSRAINL